MVQGWRTAKDTAGLASHNPTSGRIVFPQGKCTEYAIVNASSRIRDTLPRVKCKCGVKNKMKELNQEYKQFKLGNKNKLIKYYLAK